MALSESEKEKKQKESSERSFEKLMYALNKGYNFDLMYNLYGNNLFEQMRCDQNPYTKYAVCVAVCIDSLIQRYERFYKAFTDNSLILSDIINNYNSAEVSEFLEIAIKGLMYAKGKALIIDTDINKPLQERFSNYEYELKGKGVYSKRSETEEKAFIDILKTELNCYANMLVIKSYIPLLIKTVTSNTDVLQYEFKKVKDLVEYQQLKENYKRFYIQLVSMKLEDFKKTETYSLLHDLMNISRIKVDTKTLNYLKQCLSNDTAKISSFELKHYINHDYTKDGVIITYDDALTYHTQAIKMYVDGRGWTCEQ